MRKMKIHQQVVSIFSLAMPVVIIMGPAGCGKTTTGQALADTLHPPENRAKMQSGTPLNDDDRAPWLASINKLVISWAQSSYLSILACSALKRSHRERICENVSGNHDSKRPVLFVYLKVPRETLAQRLSSRQGHYMPASLLDSQLATLEEPDQITESALSIDCTRGETPGKCRWLREVLPTSSNLYRDEFSCVLINQFPGTVDEVVTTVRAQLVELNWIVRE